MNEVLELITSETTASPQASHSQTFCPPISRQIILLLRRWYSGLTRPWLNEAGRTACHQATVWSCNSTLTFCRPMHGGHATHDYCVCWLPNCQTRINSTNILLDYATVTEPTVIVHKIINRLHLMKHKSKCNTVYFVANVNSRSRSLYVVVRPSVVCLSATFVHPTQAI